MELLETKNIKKIYNTRRGMRQCVALSGISFSVQDGEFVAIMGPSGSGKTTLLNILATLDKPTEGDVLLDGKSFSAINDRDISEFRRKHLGFVFQDFNLLDTFSLKDNILLPLVLSRVPISEMEQRILPIARFCTLKNCWTSILTRCPAEKSSARRLLVPSSPIRVCCWLTNRPALWIRVLPVSFLRISLR